MKVKILVSMSAASDGSHGIVVSGDEVDLEDKVAKQLIGEGVAELLEDKPAVKIVSKPKSTNKAVKG